MTLRRLLAAIARAPLDIADGLVVGVPGPTGRRLRRWWWRPRLAHLGRRVAIDQGVRFDGARWISIGDDTWIDRDVTLLAGIPRPGRETRHRTPADATRGLLSIGSRCHIGPFAVISGLGGLSIGDDVTISTGSKLYSLSHHYRSYARPWDRSVGFGSMLPDDRQAMVEGPVVLEGNVGIGADCLVLPGVTIHRDAFVLPRSVVRRSLPGGMIAGGDPAAALSARYDEPPG